MQDSCTFCKVVAGAIPANTVFEDDLSLAFLDYRPLFPGHCLLAPKDHFETLSDLPRDLVGPFFENVQLLAKAVELALEADGSFIAINNKVSQSVPHLHVHIVPRRRKDGLKGFFWPRNKYENEAQIIEVQKLIRSAITTLQNK
jgi:histidine triad (HIT) family protein